MATASGEAAFDPLSRCVYAPTMHKIDTRQVLWANVEALMNHHWGGENLSRLAREAKIGPGSTTRMKQQATSVGLELVDKVAELFGLQTWQLLVPGLEPKSPPTLLPMSEAERALYTRLIQAAREFKDTH